MRWLTKKNQPSHLSLLPSTENRKKHFPIFSNKKRKHAKPKTPAKGKRNTLGAGEVEKKWTLTKCNAPLILMSV